MGDADVQPVHAEAGQARGKERRGPIEGSSAAGLPDRTPALRFGARLDRPDQQGVATSWRPPSGGNLAAHVVAADPFTAQLGPVHHSALCSRALGGDTGTLGP
jgi:hypothetical protein